MHWLSSVSFTLDGRTWLELGIRAIIGNYDIYQSYYLSTDGILDSHIFSRGLQCNADPPTILIGVFDFRKLTARTIRSGETAGGWQTYATEFDVALTPR
ncbi:MAG: hypothetical protein R2867_46330 [Caldilineaceae bacterium]